MNFLAKLNFSLKKPKIILVAGSGRQITIEAIFQVLRQYVKVEKISEDKLPWKIKKDKVLLGLLDLTKSPDEKKFKFLIKKSSLPILVITQVGDIPVDKNFFAGEKENVKKIESLIKNLPSQGYLILNFDDETVRELKSKTRAHSLTFGFQDLADFRATDIILTQFPEPGTNFKLNYRGNIVPIWLKSLFGKEQIYAALGSAAVGQIFEVNLVEISQALRFYKSLPGKMQLIKGIKNSWILDDSDSATIFSMAEAVEILGKMEGFNRKIAVLGDVIGIGKYTIEAHEAIGERVAKNADLLFTFGTRAKFIAQGGQRKGMPIEKIFQFDRIDDGKLKLQEEIREGDLILVDGSKEMKMREIIEEIKA